MVATSKWDDRYSQPGYAYGTIPNEFLAESVHHLPQAGDVLCLAEGEGRNSIFLAKQGFKVTAVDASSVGIQKAKSLADEHNVSIDFHVTDLERFEIAPESFDGIVSIFCHLPPTLRKKIHSAAIKGLKPGGVVILEGYRPKQLKYKTGGPPIVELLMELDELKKEFALLDLIHAQETDREIVEGRLHTGMGAVVQLIGIKNTK